MIGHHLKIAWRNLVKNRAFSVINIFGLAMGMAVVIIIGLWVMDELTFNKYHKNHDRIAQIYERSENQDSGEIRVHPAMLYVTGTILKENYADYFEHILRAYWVGDYTFELNGETYTLTGEFIEGGALEMLSMDMVRGTYSSLEEPNAVVLSESASLAIFGQGDPIGKSVKINNSMEGVVKGVYKDLPKNTRFGDVSFYANWYLYEAGRPERFEGARTVWNDYSFNLYVELKEESDFATVDAALNKFFNDHAPGDYERLQKNHPELFMFPMNKWHLFSDFQQGIATGGRITFVRLFIGIAIFVLLLACINFMNLSTARSEKRAREVGIRKSVGSRRGLLVNQFLGESLMVSSIALMLALLIVLVSLPWFNGLAGKNMVIPWENALFWGGLVLFTLITGLLAGSYPAFYLSSFSPVKVLTGRFKVGRFATTPRKVLVVFQFAVSNMLIIGTVVIFGQIRFTKERPTGYDRDNLVMIKMNDPNYEGKYNLLRDELKNTGMVKEMAQSSSPLTGLHNSDGGFDWPGKDPERDTSFGIFWITHDYGDTVGWEFVGGRNFSRKLASDSLAVIINESAVRYMGLENPVGTYITQGNSPPLKIIGVTKDMVVQSPYRPVRQSIFFLDYKRTNWISIKINSETALDKAITKIEEVFSNIVPTANFDYTFVDDDYAMKFQTEERLGNLAGVFTILAILISCLGLFGLASHIVEQRTKELGIRKVLGASVYGLWGIMSKDFLVLVFISCTIAIPIAYRFMGQWLQDYEYRMEMSWWIFVLTVVGVLIITVLTISFQTIRVAQLNPVKTLRTE